MVVTDSQNNTYSQVSYGSDPCLALEAFAGSLRRWQEGGALEIEILEQGAEHLSFNVTRWRYAEMYREMGLADLGAVLSCNRDGAFCEGYDAKLKLTRTQTLMGGATHCDFRYRWTPEG